VLSGAIRITSRDGHGNDMPGDEHGPGNFAGELSSFAPAVVRRRCGDSADTDRSRTTRDSCTLLVAEAALARR
jgi:hypothetical protein